MTPNQIAWYVQHFFTLLMPYAVAATGIALISVTPLGRAAIAWLRGYVGRGHAGELAAEVTRLRQELAETQERLDFVERRLLQSTDSPAQRQAMTSLLEPRVPTPT